MTKKDVINIREGSDGKKYWDRIGAAFVNKDGSLNVILNSLPLDGRLHIRDPKPADADKPAS